MNLNSREDEMRRLKQIVQQCKELRSFDADIPVCHPIAVTNNGKVGFRATRRGAADTRTALGSGRCVSVAAKPVETDSETLGCAPFRLTKQRRVFGSRALASKVDVTSFVDNVGGQELDLLARKTIALLLYAAPYPAKVEDVADCLHVQRMLGRVRNLRSAVLGRAAHLLKESFLLNVVCFSRGGPDAYGTTVKWLIVKQAVYHSSLTKVLYTMRDVELRGFLLFLHTEFHRSKSPITLSELFAAACRVSRADLLVNVDGESYLYDIELRIWCIDMRLGLLLHTVLYYLSDVYPFCKTRTLLQGRILFVDNVFFKEVNAKESPSSFTSIIDFLHECVLLRYIEISRRTGGEPNDTNVIVIIPTDRFKLEIDVISFVDKCTWLCGVTPPASYA